MLVGKRPFTGNDEDAMFESIIRDAVQFPSHLSTEATSIIKGVRVPSFFLQFVPRYPASQP
ncbi:PKN2 kinase, partial [Amia calva]|nr:PKN2 kinase [Amia calva]